MKQTITCKKLNSLPITFVIHGVYLIKNRAQLKETTINYTDKIIDMEIEKYLKRMNIQKARIFIKNKGEKVKRHVKKFVKTENQLSFLVNKLKAFLPS